MFQLFFAEKIIYDYASAKTADNAKYLMFPKKPVDARSIPSTISV
jgi:hypothetical protein